MFTGIVRGQGVIQASRTLGGDTRLEVDRRGVDLGPVALGDSIAVNGCCLTVVEFDACSFCADVSLETLDLTTLGALEVGSAVNLEPALRAGDALGGHLVSGHVDGLAELVGQRDDARSRRFEFRAPDALARYVARKGSVCLDGVSLTVNDVNGSLFGINVVPHTLEVTTLGALVPGQSVNLEIDTIARYVERLMTAEEGMN
jgi:riboflavin synthase